MAASHRVCKTTTARKVPGDRSQPTPSLGVRPPQGHRRETTPGAVPGRTKGRPEQQLTLNLGQVLDQIADQIVRPVMPNSTCGNLATGVTLVDRKHRARTAW
jgi:hypothetical protein